MGKKCHVAGLTNPSGVDLRSKSGEIILTIHTPKMSVPDQGDDKKGWVFRTDRKIESF
ncbi:MAG: hypothetical protein NTV65_03305 [Proteobacteria bacterium]|nr:hypothetical protein [Pseudomonadota bacterium]